MDLKNIKTLEDLKLAKNKFYGPEGELKKMQFKIRTVSKEDRAFLGKKISELKETGEKAFALKAAEIEISVVQDKVNSEWIDVTTPVKQTGSIHPLALISNRIKEWFTANGYTRSKGTEIESDEFNFERLNIPKEHPARDMQDSLYIDNETLMRTHNTGFSARELAKNKNQELSTFAIGKVYRNDEDDATHSHQFTQLDFVSVGQISFSNLIWTLKSMLSYVFEEKLEIRLRPSYFPFTEPSVEVDVFYHNKWIEVLGAGILHNNVLKMAGYTNDMSAMAAGVGIERLAMIKYGIKNIREFYKNDLRFLNQFKEVK